MFGDYSKAVENAENTEKYQDGAVGLIFVPLFHFYDSLARLAVFSGSDESVQKQILKKVAVNQKKMKKWANHAPMNHLHKYYLVKAELLRVQSLYTEAGDYYDQAINLANEHEYINEEALANELAARFYEDNGKTKLASAFIRDARSCYLRWNAAAKVKDLDARYGHLLAGMPISFALHADKVVNLTTRTSDDLDAGLDLASVMKASQAISGEIVLENLLKRLMKIVIENAGAETGFLILKSNGRLQIEAEGILEREDVTVLQSVPVEESNKLSISIVNYVIRTLEFVVLGNAACEGNFTKDPYVVENQPKSVLCAPVIHKSQLIGVLYLENNLSTGAFTVERLEMLRLLSTQIAISLENATLFTNLEESELRYRELYENIVDIVILVDDNDRILIANPLFYTIFNISESNEQDMMFKQWIHPDDVLLVEEQMLAKLEDVDTVRDFQFRLVTKQVKVLDVECNAKSVKKENNRSEFQMVIRDITARKKLQKNLINSIKDVQNARSGTILGLAKLAEYRDEDTGSHLERIREYSRVIAVEMSKKIEYKDYITQQYIDDIYLSAILHDIGKVGIPDAILLKKGKLTYDEFEIIKQHTIYGGDAISAIEKHVGGQSFLALGKEIAYYHHEKWDGSGYPKGLRGEEIPLSTRIVALADVYDALTSKRSYKDAFSHEKSTEIIVNSKGTHFAPDVVDAFLSVEPIFKMIREKHD